MKMKLIVLVLGLIVLAAVGICGCGKHSDFAKQISDKENLETQQISLKKEDLHPQTNVDSTDTDADDSPQLTALADSLEDAQEIAELYGIELESYSYGVASYRTDKDISELINFGTENDYPTLSPNIKNQLYIELEDE